MRFTSKNPAFHHLKKKWTSRHQSLQNKLWNKHGDILNKVAAGSVGGLMLLSAPLALALPKPNLALSKEDLIKGVDKNIFLAAHLQEKVPKEMRNLTPDEEAEIAKLLSDNFNFKVVPEIGSIRLNRTYGVIGGEQHLYRFPGDNLYKHADTTQEWAMFSDAGMAPHLGAWGYFAPSEAQFSQENKMREKYYIAVQTFLSPGFAENVSEYRDFFKYRKMLVVNPKTGQAVVCDIGDAGPSDWTGKHLGGSPEVMHALGLGEGSRSGEVLYFFIDDSAIVPLGPI